MYDNKTQLQIKVYSKWVANKLKDVHTCHVNDITQDLADGVALIELAHILTEDDIPEAYTRKSRSKFNEIEKCDQAILMFTNNGVKLGMSETTISGREINEKNVKQTLSLVWLLILNYSIDPAVREDKNFKFHTSNINIDLKNIAKRNSIKLLAWATGKTKKYSNTEDDFSPYDLSLCALLCHYFPNEISYSKLDPTDHEKNLKIANRVMQNHNIPIFITPEDLKDVNYKVDEGSLMTQLSALKESLDKILPSRTSLVGRQNPFLNQLKNEYSEKQRSKTVPSNSYVPKQKDISELENDSGVQNPQNEIPINDSNKMKPPLPRNRQKNKPETNDQNSEQPGNIQNTNEKHVTIKQFKNSDTQTDLINESPSASAKEISSEQVPRSPKRLRIRVNGNLDRAIVITVKRKSHKPQNKNSSNQYHSNSLGDSQCEIVPIYDDDNSNEKRNDFNVKVQNNDYEIEKDFPDSVSGMQVFINKDKKNAKNDDE